MRLGPCLLSLLVIFSPQGFLAQQKYPGWQEIDPSSSIEAFKAYESFFSEIYRWEVEAQTAYLERGYEAGRMSGADSLLSKWAERLGYFYIGQGNLTTSYSLLNEALTHSFSPVSRGKALNSLGILHMQYEDYNAALDYYFQALDEAKKLDNGSETYPIGNLSEIYYLLGDYQNAIKYLKYSIRFSNQLEGPRRMYAHVFDFSQLALYYQKSGRIDSAGVYLDLALENIHQIEQLEGSDIQDALFYGGLNVADYYLNAGEAENARKYLQKARKFTQDSDENAIRFLEAKYYVSTGDYRSALGILENDTTDNHGDVGVLRLMVECYREMDQPKNIVGIQDKIIANQEERFGEDRLRYTAFADVKYETIRKEEEIKSLRLNQAVQELTIQNQRFNMLLNSLLALFLAGGAIFLWQRYHNRNKLSKYLQKQVDLKTRDLRKANEDLRVLNFVASHDLKEPINNIRNYLGLIENRIPQETKSDLNFFFEIIHNSIGQVYTLVEDLAKYLRLANDETVKTSLVDLDKLTDEVFVSLDSYVLERKGELINGGSPEIYTNSSLLQVILKNLVQNGLKFNDAPVPRVEVQYEDTPNGNQIRVSDNGIGIEAQFQDKVFENFKRLHNREEYEGSGMGLAIVKLLVEKLGGDIRVESHVGEGSTFTITLPKEANKEMGRRIDLANALRPV